MTTKVSNPQPPLDGNEQHPEWNKVDMIASGYEWICLNCENMQKEIEVLESVTCKECGCSFSLGDYEHALP